MSTLRDVQRAFARAVFDESEAAGLDALIRGNGLDGARRIRIYRNNFRIGLREALAAVYPATKRLVGDDFFRQAARGYVLRVRSDSGDIHRYGGGFSAHLAALPELTDYPYLADVAGLEWAYHRVFHTALAAPLDPMALRAVAPDAYPSLRFRLQPAAQLIRSAYPVLRIRRVNLDDWCGERDVRLDAGAARVLVMRSRDRVLLESLAVGDHAFLERLATGATLADACAAASACDPAHDPGDALRRFVAGGVLVDFFLESGAASGAGSLSTPEV